MALTDDLIARWRFDAAGPLADSVGGNALTNHNGVTSAAGVLGEAAAFASASLQRLSRPDNASLSLGADQSFTWVFWVRFDTVQRTWLVSKYNAGAGETHEYTVEYDSGSFRFYVGNGTAFAQATLVLVPAVGEWYMIAARHDAAADVLSLSADAAAPATAAWSGGTQDTSAPLSIGAYAGGAYYLDGLMDDAKFWKRSLTDAELAFLRAADLAGIDWLAMLSGGGGTGSGVRDIFRPTRLRR